MEISEYVRSAIDNRDRAELEPAMLAAVIAVDGTATKAIERSRNGFVRFVDDHLWMIEPMLGVGMNLETTRFWVTLAKRESKFSEVIYEIYRVNLAHGAPLPGGSGLAMAFSPNHRKATFAEGVMTLPDTVIPALLAPVVFARVNAGQRIGDEYFLSYGEREFVIDEWWGKEDEVRDYFGAELARLPRVTMNF